MAKKKTEENIEKTVKVVDEVNIEETSIEDVQEEIVDEIVDEIPAESIEDLSTEIEAESSDEDSLESTEDTIEDTIADSKEAEIVSDQKVIELNHEYATLEDGTIIPVTSRLHHAELRARR